MKTPIEVMAKAISGVDLGKAGWSEEAARAALLALAEVELPEEATSAGFGQLVAKERHARLQERFRAILRSLAGDLFQITAEPTIAPSGHQDIENVE